jgi:thioredoxin 1
MYARSSSRREASATEEAEAAQGCSMGNNLSFVLLVDLFDSIIILLSVPIFVCVFIQSAEQHLYIGLSLCSQQRSPPKQEIATRDLHLPNTAASHQGRGEGNKQQMATTVPAIRSNEELKDVLRKAKEPNSNLVVLEFTAPWSEPCKFMRPALEVVASDFKDQADFYTLDVEHFKTFARNTRVEALPTFLLVRKTILERVISVSKDELQRSIAKHISRTIAIV